MVYSMLSITSFCYNKGEQLTFCRVGWQGQNVYLKAYVRRKPGKLTRIHLEIQLSYDKRHN